MNPVLQRDAARKAPPGSPSPGGARLHAWLLGSSPRPDAAQGSPLARALLVSAMLNILGAALFGFLAHVAILGNLEHNRDQQVAYDDLRLTLAEGTAPVGPVEGKPVGLAEPIARMTIPAIGLKEVVLEGTTSGVLRSAPGHRRDTVLPGQAGTSVLMGRRMAYGGPFSSIAQLVRDDEIKIVTGQGEAVYKVLGVRHAGDPQPPALASGAGRLTLMTTSGSRFAAGGVDRVDADLVGTAQPAATPAFTPATLPADERTLAGEPSALGPAVGWGFLLACAGVLVTGLRLRWGRWQAWIVAVPVLGYLGMEVSDNVARLLPNLF